MFKKRMSIIIPKDKICICGERCRHITNDITHDDNLRVIYTCACGESYCYTTHIKYV